MTGDHLCQQFEPDWELASLGALDDAQIREMERHLEGGCATCGQRFAQAQRSLAAIGQDLPEEPLPPQLEARLRDRIAVRKPALSVVSPKPAGLRPRPAVLLPWIAAAAAVLVAAWLNADRSRLMEQLRQARNAPPPPVVRPVDPVVPPVVPPLVKIDPPKREVVPVQEPSRELVAELAGLRKKVEELSVAGVEARTRNEELRQMLAAASSRASDAERSLREAQAQIVALNTAPPKPQAQPERQLAAAADPALLQELARKEARLQSLSRQAAELRSMLRVLQGGSLRQVELRPSDPGAQGSSARVLISAGGVLVVARQLPKIPQGKCFQLWLIRKGSPSIVSGGLMEIDAQGGGVLFAPPSDSLAQVTGFAITDEPAGGSRTAQGHKLLFGAL